MLDSIKHLTYSAIIEPSEAIIAEYVGANCHWIAGKSPNVVFSSNTVKIDFTVFPRHSTPFTSEKYAYRRIFHYVESALQAQMVLFSGQPIVQKPNRLDLLEKADLLPQFSSMRSLKTVSAYHLGHGFQIANIVDLFPYLRWSLRDYYLSKFFPSHDGITFCWRALASILRHIAEGDDIESPESEKNIKFVSEKLCIDKNQFIHIKKWANHAAYHGRHSTVRAADRTKYLKNIFKNHPSAVVDEAAMSSIFNPFGNAKSSIMKDAIDFLPPSITNEEWSTIQKFTQDALVKFIQYLSSISLSDLIGRGINPIFGANPCHPDSLDFDFLPPTS